jgi:hypothetical protein
MIRLLHRDKLPQMMLKLHLGKCNRFGNSQRTEGQTLRAEGQNLSCTVSNHSKKAAVNTSHYYVLDPSRNDPVAFLEPSLPYDRTDKTFRSLLDANSLGHGMADDVFC